MSVPCPTRKQCREGPMQPVSLGRLSRLLSTCFCTTAGSCSPVPVQDPQPPLGSCTAAGRTLSCLLGCRRPLAATCALTEAGLCNIRAALQALQVTAQQPAFATVSGGLTATNSGLPAAELAISAATAENKAQPGWDEALGVRCPTCQCLECDLFASSVWLPWRACLRAHAHPESSAVLCLPTKPGSPADPLDDWLAAGETPAVRPGNASGL